METLWYEVAREKLCRNAQETPEGFVLEMKMLRRVMGSHLKIPRHLQRRIFSELVLAGVIKRVSIRRVVVFAKPGERK